MGAKGFIVHSKQKYTYVSFFFYAQKFPFRTMSCAHPKNVNYAQLFLIVAISNFPLSRPTTSADDPHPLTSTTTTESDPEALYMNEYAMWVGDKGKEEATATTAVSNGTEATLVF